jgi:hypothetical protein
VSKNNPFVTTTFPPGTQSGLVTTTPSDRGFELLARYANYEELAISVENPYTPVSLRMKVLGLILLDLHKGESK